MVIVRTFSCAMIVDFNHRWLRRFLRTPLSPSPLVNLHCPSHDSELCDLILAIINLITPFVDSNGSRVWQKEIDQHQQKKKYLRQYKLKEAQQNKEQNAKPKEEQENNSNGITMAYYKNNSTSIEGENSVKYEKKNHPTLEQTIYKPWKSIRESIICKFLFLASQFVRQYTRIFIKIHEVLNTSLGEETTFLSHGVDVYHFAVIYNKNLLQQSFW